MCVCMYISAHKEIYKTFNYVYMHTNTLYKRTPAHIHTHICRYVYAEKCL